MLDYDSRWREAEQLAEAEDERASNPAHVCKNCGESRIDWLELDSDDGQIVTCLSCYHEWRLD